MKCVFRWFHQWSKWKDCHGDLELMFQTRLCARCGKRQLRSTVVL